MDVSPGSSHSSPIKDSQPSGFCKSEACWVRQASSSLWEYGSCAGSESGKNAIRARISNGKEWDPRRRIKNYNVNRVVRENELD